MNKRWILKHQNMLPWDVIEVIIHHQEGNGGKEEPQRREEVPKIMGVVEKQQNTILVKTPRFWGTQVVIGHWHRQNHQRGHQKGNRQLIRFPKKGLVVKN